MIKINDEIELYLQSRIISVPTTRVSFPHKFRAFHQFLILFVSIQWCVIIIVDLPRNHMFLIKPQEPNLKEMAHKHKICKCNTCAGTHIHIPTDLLELPDRFASFDSLCGPQTSCNRHTNFHNTIASNHTCHIVAGSRCNTVPCLYTDPGLYSYPCVHANSLHQSNHIG